MTEEEIIAKYNEIMARRKHELEMQQLRDKVDKITNACDNLFCSVDARLVIDIVHMGADGNHPCGQEEEEFRLSKNELKYILNHLYLAKGN